MEAAQCFILWPSTFRIRLSKSFAPSLYDSKLLLLCYNILRSLGYQASAVDEFVAALVAALKELPIIPGIYAGEAMLLRRFHAGRWAMTRGTGFINQSSLQLLRSTRKEVHEICGTICAVTLFGGRSPRMERERSIELSRVLSVLLLECLRKYDLETGATLLRAIYFARFPAGKVIESASMFLRTQQQADGRFGYYSREVMSLPAREDTSSFDPVLHLYLPIALSCVWSLAEINVPQFNLFAEVIRC